MLIYIKYNFRHYIYGCHHSLMIGKGTKRHGQLDWISLAEVDTDDDGTVIYATQIWSFPSNIIRWFRRLFK